MYIFIYVYVCIYPPSRGWNLCDQQQQQQQQHTYAHRYKSCVLYFYRMLVIITHMHTRARAHTHTHTCINICIVTHVQCGAADHHHSAHVGHERNHLRHTFLLRRGHKSARKRPCVALCYFDGCSNDGGGHDSHVLGMPLSPAPPTLCARVRQDYMHIILSKSTWVGACVCGCDTPERTFHGQIHTHRHIHTHITCMHVCMYMQSCIYTQHTLTHRHRHRHTHTFFLGN